MADPLLILGGTFDPPHIGHLVLGECARHQFGGRVVYLPAGDPWRKTSGAIGERRAISPAPLRLEMIAAAVRGNRHFSVDDREVRRRGPSYTVETLAEYHAEGVTDLVLVIGSDALADLPNWREPERIRALARIAVTRKTGETATFPDWVTEIAMPPLALSSTLVRARVARGEPIRYLVPDAVERIIRREGLYRARGPLPA